MTLRQSCMNQLGTEVGQLQQFSSDAELDVNRASYLGNSTTVIRTVNCETWSMFVWLSAGLWAHSKAGRLLRVMNLLGLLLNSPVYPSRQCCFQCSQGRVLAGVGGQLLLWNAITSLSWSIKGFNIFCTCYNGNLFKFLLLWLCSSVLPLWFLLTYLLWPKKSASSSLGRRKSPLTTGWENLSQLCILICLGLIQRPSALQVLLFCVISILSVFLWEKQN